MLKMKMLKMKMLNLKKKMFKFIKSLNLKRKCLNLKKKMFKFIKSLNLKLKNRGLILKKIKPLFFNFKKTFFCLIFIKMYFNKYFVNITNVKFNLEASILDKQKSLMVFQKFHKSILNNSDNLDIAEYYILLKEYEIFLRTIKDLFSKGKCFDFQSFKTFVTKEMHVNPKKINPKLFSDAFNEFISSKEVIEHTVDSELHKVISKVSELENKYVFIDLIKDLDLENNSKSVLNFFIENPTLFSDYKFFYFFFNNFCYIHYISGIIPERSYTALVGIFETTDKCMEYLINQHIYYLMKMDPIYFYKRIQYLSLNLDEIKLLSNSDIINTFEILYNYSDRFQFLPQYMKVYKAFFDIAFERNLFNKYDVFVGVIDGSTISITLDTASKTFDYINVLLEILY